MGNDIPGAGETSNGIHFEKVEEVGKAFQKDENDQLRLIPFKCRTRQIAQSQDGDQMVQCLECFSSLKTKDFKNSLLLAFFGSKNIQ